MSSAASDHRREQSAHTIARAVAPALAHAPGDSPDVVTVAIAGATAVHRQAQQLAESCAQTFAELGLVAAENSSLLLITAPADGVHWELHLPGPAPALLILTEVTRCCDRNELEALLARCRDSRVQSTVVTQNCVDMAPAPATGVQSGAGAGPAAGVSGAPVRSAGGAAGTGPRALPLPWQPSQFFALGFCRWPLAPGEGVESVSTRTMELYGYSLRDYKLTPDWFNARHWAHPERWEL